MKHILLLALLASCGPAVQVDQAQPVPYAGIGIDDAFFTQVLAFEAEWGHQVTNVDMFFVDRINGPEAGTCFYYDEPKYQRAIRIDREVWDQWESPEFREILIMHELSHCVLNRGHDSFFTKNGCARSIMNPNVGNVLPCYKKWRQYYIDELFGRSPDSN
jgi:hypothetical protein